MVKEFLEGETYRNPKQDKDVMVYAVASSSKDEVVLVVGFVDRVSEEMLSTGEITVKKSEFADWEIVEL